VAAKKHPREGELLKLFRVAHETRAYVAKRMRQGVCGKGLRGKSDAERLMSTGVIWKALAAKRD